MLTLEVKYCHWEGFPTLLEHSPIAGIIESLLPSLVNHWKDSITTKGCVFGMPSYI